MSEIILSGYQIVTTEKECQRTYYQVIKLLQQRKSVREHTIRLSNYYNKERVSENILSGYQIVTTEKECQRTYYQIIKQEEGRFDLASKRISRTYLFLYIEKSCPFSLPIVHDQIHLTFFTWQSKTDILDG